MRYAIICGGLRAAHLELQVSGSPDDLAWMRDRRTVDENDQIASLHRIEVRVQYLLDLHAALCRAELDPQHTAAGQIIGARGTERLRITPSPLHSDDDIDRLVDALRHLWRQCALASAAA